MDEGRNMILLFPTLIEGINTPAGRKAFRPSCHMFYSQRVCDLKDGVEKWTGLDFASDKLDDNGKVIEKYNDNMKDEAQEKKRKRTSDSQKQAKKEQKQHEEEQEQNS